MTTENKVPTEKSVEDRLRGLEQTRAYVIGGVIVGAVLLSLYVPYNSFFQIPREVRQAIEDQRPDIFKALYLALKRAEDGASEIERLLESIQRPQAVFRIESGTVRIERDDRRYRQLNEPRQDECADDAANDRGALDEWVDFHPPFNEPPTVAVALSRLDHIQGSNLRINAEVSRVNEQGFAYNLHTWCDTKIAAVAMTWVAYGR